MSRYAHASTPSTSSSAHAPLAGALLLILALIALPASASAQGGLPASDSTDQGVSNTPRTVSSLPSLSGSNPDTVRAGHFDDGRMWTFDAPPLDYFASRYGFRPDDEWLRRARLGALRIPGCTASFVSPQGLVLTNHHCGRDYATQVSREGENLLQEGFYATSTQQERAVEGLYADQLVNISDVTEEVETALADAETDAERAEARRRVFEQIENRLVREAGGDEYVAEVVPLYDGAIYSGYTYRRYQDVRLVMIPELQMGYYGGDPDNFTYPRYTLDMSIFRVYEDGQPLQTEHFFEWEADGSRPGDATFVVGNPGSTLRLETYAQLLFRRDVQDVSLRDFLDARVQALRQYIENNPEERGSLENALFSLENALKLYRGRVRALNDDYIMARIEAGDENFKEAIRGADSLRAVYGGLFDSMQVIQQQKRDYAPTYQAFRLVTNPLFSSATLRRALQAYPLLTDSTAVPAERLREQLAQVGNQSDGLDALYLEARLRDIQHYYTNDTTLVEQVLAGQSPEARAEAIISSSVLADSARAVEAAANGTLALDDPALQLVDAFHEQYQTYQSAFAGLMERQADVNKRLGQARYAVYGTDVPPDATFTLRIADGRVLPYGYNGTIAPPYTTYFGLYSHYYAYGEDSPWDIPDSWKQPPPSFDRSTPLNMISSNDITGGNSGSPVLNRDLKLVGLVFDGNIESLAGDYIFLPNTMRSVSVDVRGMLEALDEIYDADRLVQELTGGTFVETEAAADESRPDAR